MRSALPVLPRIIVVRVAALVGQTSPFIFSKLARSSKVRVAAIIDTRILSGPGRQLAALASQVERRGVQFLIVAIQRRGVTSSPFIDFIRAANLAYDIVFEEHAFDVNLARAVRSTLEEFQPDIVQTHGYKPTVIATVLKATGSCWKWIGFWHGATAENRKVRAYHWIDSKLIRRADLIIVMSEPQRALFEGNRMPVRIVANAVIPLRAIPATDQVFLGALAHPLLAVIGRLSSEKGVDVFLKAAHRLAQEHIQFSALIVGDGPDRVTLERLSVSLGLEEHVHFMGSRQNMREIYEAIDLLVIPSRSEGLPNVLLEALGHDRPVVATAVGAIPSVLSSGDVGVLVPPESPEALALGIRSAFALRTSPQATSARRRVAEAFSLEARVRIHCDIYKSLLATSSTT